MPAALTLGALLLGKLVIPEPPSRLLSFRFGQQTKAFGGRFWVLGFCFASPIRAIQTLAKCSAIFREGSVEAHRGGDIVDAEALLREGKARISHIPPQWLGGPQWWPTVQFRQRGALGVQRVWRNQGGRGAPGPLWCQPRQLGFLLFVIQAPDSALVAEYSLQTWQL